jgi:hypothetical protein
VKNFRAICSGGVIGGLMSAGIMSIGGLNPGVGLLLAAGWGAALCIAVCLEDRS